MIEGQRMGHVKLCSVHLSSQSNQLWHPVAVGKSYRAVNKHGMLSVFILSTLGWSLPWGRFQGGLLNLEGLNTNALVHGGDLFSSFARSALMIYKNEKAVSPAKGDKIFWFIKNVQHKFMQPSMRPNYLGNDTWPLWIQAHTSTYQSISLTQWHLFKSF